MGIESAVYAFVPNATTAIRHVLTGLGATQTAAIGDDYDRWVLRVPEQYWIDLMLGELGGPGRAALSVRVAVCNPVAVEERLHLLLEALFQTGGRLYDQQTRTWHTNLGEQTWASVLNGYRAKRQAFLTVLGEFEAAISGDDVLRTMQRLGKARHDAE